MYRECRLPKGQSLGGAPCVETVARVMTAMALRLRMSQAERFFLDGNDPFEQRLSVIRVTALAQQAGNVAEVCGRIDMLGAEHLLIDRQRALDERLRRRQVALGLKHVGEGAETHR